MGYDMYVVDENGQDVEGGEDFYWRRNMSGGRVQAQKLVDAGMGYWPREELPNLPTVPPGSTQEEATKIEYEFLKATYDERPGIAVYKLCNTNDGWWVTKAECASALALWEQNGRPEVDNFGGRAYNDTIPFLRAAAKHGGFRVW